MDDNTSPIIEKKTIFERFREMYRRVMKPVKYENYFSSPYLIEDNDTYQYTDYVDTVRALQEALNKYGCSTREMCDGILRFDHILSPNEMRDIMGVRKKYE